MFEAIRQRLERLQTAGARAMPRAAARVAEKYRADAVSRRGNVPPHQVTGDEKGIRVTAPDWSLEIAAREGQPAEWAEIARDEIRKELA